VLVVTVGGAVASPERAFLDTAPAKLETGLFGQQDRLNGERLLERSSAGQRQALALMLSRYYRELEARPLECLPQLGPLVLEAAESRPWTPRWRDLARGAATPGPDSRLMPPVSSWKLSSDNLPAALELARIHAAAGQGLEALRIADAVGSRFDGLGRVLAAEVSAEAMLAVPDLARSAEFYEYALKGLGTLVSGDGRWLELVGDSGAGALGEAIARTARTLAERGQTLREARRIQAPARIVASLEQQIASAQRRLERLRALPAGEAAAAHVIGLKLAEDRPFGLYRGEILLCLAQDAFHRQMDPKQAQTLYERAWKWLEQVGGHDAAIAAFEVPGQARQVSQPPPQEISKEDLFGNVRRATPDVGAIVNRRTCPWYLDDLREHCVLALGFLAFYRGENATALEWYAKLPALDAATARLQSSGDWNNSSRLKWGAEHGYLFAHPEELALFQGRQRFTVLLADFQYVTERFALARALYRRLLQGDFGKLSPQAADYACYGSASCTYWLEGHSKAYPEYLAVLAQRQGTFTEDRAAYAAGRMAAAMEDPRIRAQGIALLKTLAESGRRNDFVYRAMITGGLRLIASGQDTEGVRLLEQVPRQLDGYYALAQLHLQESRKAVDKNGGRR